MIKKRLIAIVGILIILFTLGSPVLAIDYTPSAIKIWDVDVYANAVETGDMIFFVDFTITYALPLPTEPISETFFVRLLDSTGVEVTNVVPYAFFDNGYNRGIAVMYFNATAALSLTWGGSYSMKLAGNPSATWTGTPPIPFSPSVTTFNWKPTYAVSTQRGLIANKILAYASTLTGVWADVDYVLYTTQSGKGYLTSVGQAYFSIVVPYLTTIAGNILQNYQVTPTIIKRDTSGTSWQTSIDAYTHDTVFEKPRLYLGTLFGVSGRMVTGTLWLVAMLFIIYKASKMVNSYKPAMLLSFPLLVFGCLVGWMPVLVGLGFGFFCGVISIYVFSLEKSSS
jgi:hypothetical protein